MGNDLILKLERASRDRDFFILNKDKIEKSYLYLDDILAKFIDICCMKFKTVSLNKTAYIYGSIITLAAAFVASNKIHFTTTQGNAIEYLVRDIFPLFMDQYNTTTLVSDKTQVHMLKGCVEEYKNIVDKKAKYVAGQFDEYFDASCSDFKKFYLNQILLYFLDHKREGFDKKDVAVELLPLISKIFDNII